MRIRPAPRPASEPEPALAGDIVRGVALGVAAHVLVQRALWDPDSPSIAYGLIGLTQAVYLVPTAALVWRWPRGWRVGIGISAVAALLLNASMLHLVLLRP